MKKVCVLLFFCWLFVGCQTTPKSQSNQSVQNANIPSATHIPQTSPVAISPQVMTLAGLDGLGKESAEVRQISDLLLSLDNKYPEDSAQIVNLTAEAYRQIQTRGKKVSVLNIMKAMLDTPNRGNNYSDIIDNYVIDATKN